MGSDLSRPRARRHSSIDSMLRQNRRCVSNLPARELDYACVPEPMPIIRDFRRDNCPRPVQVNYCRQEQSPPAFMERKPIAYDPCLDPCRQTSRCSTPIQAPCIPAPRETYYTDIPIEPRVVRSSRYNTVGAGRYPRDCDYYVEKPESILKEPRQYTVKKPYQTKIDCDYIPAERIYEIRKEKVLIKADRTSQSPPRLRSKSSDRYIEVPKTVRIIDSECLKAAEKACTYETTTEGFNKSSKLKSRSGYILSSDEDRPYRVETSSNRSSRVNLEETPVVMPKPLNQNLTKSQCSVNNDIIYVPMVREEFIKRESQKLNSDSDQSIIMGQDGTGEMVTLPRFTSEYKRDAKRPGRIIISEINPLVKLPSTENTTTLKSILKTSPNLVENINNSDMVNSSYSELSSTKSNNSTLVEQIKINTDNRNALVYERYVSNNPSPSASPITLPTLASRSSSNFKYCIDKEGNLYNFSPI